MWFIPENSVPVASIEQRIRAATLDYAIVVVPYYIYIVIFDIGATGIMYGTCGGNKFILPMYFFLFEVIGSQSLGKQILGIKAISFDGQPTSFLQRLFRFMIVFSFTAAFAAHRAYPNNDFGPLGGCIQRGLALGLFLLCTPFRAALHDLLTRTLVINTAKSQSPVVNFPPQAKA